MSIGWLMFWKALVLSLWGAVEIAWETFQKRKADKALVGRFQQEWDRRRAKQPLALADLRTDHLEAVRPAE